MPPQDFHVANHFNPLLGLLVCSLPIIAALAVVYVSSWAKQLGEIEDAERKAKQERVRRARALDDYLRGR